MLKRSREFATLGSFLMFGIIGTRLGEALAAVSLPTPEQGSGQKNKDICAICFVKMYLCHLGEAIAPSGPPWLRLYV